MNITRASLLPVPVTAPTAQNAKALRTHQGIPGIAKMPSGRLLTTWYTGGTTECRLNYVLLAYSDDDGMTWTEAGAVIDPPHPDVRAFDATLWLTPDGRLLWFWAQGCGGPDGVCGICDEVFDGLVGVWFVEVENPDAAAGQFRFSAPRRIANGIMLNKPAVLADGTWALPCSLWSVKCAHRDFQHDLNPVYGAMMVTSQDNGKTFNLRGTLDVNTLGEPPSFDEHMFLERKDGAIACYVRCNNGVGISLSRDGGATWSDLKLTDLPGKDCRFFIGRLASGRVLLVANDSFKCRERLTAFLSEDDGATWPHKLLLDERKGVSYPDAIQDGDGHLYITYDYNRTQGGYLYMARLDEADILSGHLSAASFLRREIDHSHPVPPKGEDGGSAAGCKASQKP